MDFILTDRARAWQEKGARLGGAAALRGTSSPGGVAPAAVGLAQSLGLLAPDAEAFETCAAVEAAAAGAPSVAVAFALHVTALVSLGSHPRWGEPLRTGRIVGALALAADVLPVCVDNRLTGTASWVAAVTASGVMLVGAHRGANVEAFAVALNDAGVTVHEEAAAGLAALQCAHVALESAAAEGLGDTEPIMARARLLMAAVGLGLGTCALETALAVARLGAWPDGEMQAVQGLLADAATELDAARLVTWAAAGSGWAVSLGAASAAKLAATRAALGAVERAIQVVGVDSFREGHVLAGLARDARALELFAGRTETLRAAVGVDTLPPSGRVGAGSLFR